MSFFFVFFCCLDSLCELVVSEGERHAVMNKEQKEINRIEKGGTGK